jgi:hypothetical protein
MLVTCYIDYTCPYSFRAFQWLTRLRDAAGVQPRWATFSLKEANRDPGTPSPFDDPQISSLSVLALALAHAARDTEASRYHGLVFEAMHGGGPRLSEPALLELAGEAGVDVERFAGQRGRWLDAVAAEHHDAVRRFAVFGTPTLVIDDRTAVFLKLAQAPPPEQDAELWSSVYTLACCQPDLVEIKRTPSTH